MNLKLLIWVTSDCNLQCPLCNQKHALRLNPKYHMETTEIDSIVESCLGRNIKFDVIELIGGEMSLWKNIKYGLKEFSKITDDIFFVTNGNNPEFVKSLGMKHWIVSSSQASKSQMDQYAGSSILLNSHYHRPVPLYPVENSVPADCVVDRSPFDPGIKENGVAYLRGKIYYCNLAFGLSDRVPLTEDMVCDFEEDFVSKFADKKFDKEICKYCLCNSKVFQKI